MIVGFIRDIEGFGPATIELNIEDGVLTAHIDGYEYVMNVEGAVEAWIKEYYKPNYERLTQSRKG